MAAMASANVRWSVVLPSSFTTDICCACTLVIAAMAMNRIKNTFFIDSKFL